MFVHLHTFGTTPPLRTPETCSREEWLGIARAWYRFYYTYYDRTEEELAYIAAQEEWLRKSIPEDLAQGLHLIHPEGGFMGEDVWIVDGTITHTIHVPHDKCGETYLIWRGPRVWCVKCSEYEEQKEGEV